MALDYGMALARGLIAPQKELREEVQKLAGDQFKSEDWWNKQFDRQIKEGITKTKTKTQYLAKSHSSYSQPFWADGTGQGATGMYGSGPRPYRQGSMYGPIRTRQVEYQEQRDLSANELKEIQNQSKEQTRLTKRAANQAKKRNRKRTAAGSSGLLGRSNIKKKGLAEDMPALGSTSLGKLKTMLG
jgi:small-conductance mechanosensitive channel